MKIEFITNASILITTGSGRTILCDPWYSDGIYYGSWYNFPPLSEVGQRRYTGLEPDYIYISHIHPDHLDPVTLARYPKGTPILVGHLPHNHLTRTIARIGFRDIRLLPLESTSRIDDFEITIYGDFAPTSANIPSDIDYAINTSLLLRDADETQLFHAVDNAIQVKDCQRIVDRHGKIQAALLPYAGASLYPHAFTEYSEAEKDRRRDSLMRKMLERFLAVAEALDAPVTIPAAGSYVMGGALAGYNRWLHQAPPSAIHAAWNAAGKSPGALAFLCEGDVLDVASGEIVPNADAAFRDYSTQERVAYGNTLADCAL